MKIGVFGGTFDPIHRGHILVAAEAKERLGLAEVIFVPAGQPWLKEGSPILPATHRVRMVQLAIASQPGFKLSTMEIDRAGPSYTVESIAELKRTLAAKDELFFILGWDSLAQLPKWREPGRLAKLCRLVAVPRPGYPPPALDVLEAAVPGLVSRLIMLDKPEVDIDATEIRHRVGRGLPIDHLVPTPVAAYIEQQGLYRES